MFAILGGVVAFWIIYAIIAKCTRHETGLKAALIIGLLAGLGGIMSRGDYTTVCAAIIGAICVAGIEGIQVNKKTDKN